MIWKIKKIGNGKTTDFAVSELIYYLKKMNSEIQIEEKVEDDGEGLSIGCSNTFDEILPVVEDKTLDDAIYINVKDGKGIITGTNTRSVLIAVYRYLKELGCKFIRPGRDNEVIPKINPLEATVYVSEKASYRHRGVCIEGASSYEHIADIIDWLPKISMNGYYIQFIKPYGFFQIWYNHKGNPYMKPEEKSSEELDKIVNSLEDEIQQRGLIYYRVGHTWNSESIGMETTYWNKADEPDEKIKKYLAEINGERNWHGGQPIGTNLCYSNPEVRELMTDYAVDYCRKNPHVSHIVFWLADGFSNYCECSECKKSRLADLYVKLLNRLDEKLTEANIDTKVVFSIQYNWPQTEKIKNRDRFVMMIYPIYKNYAQPFPSEIDENTLPEIPVYEDNAIVPRYFKTVEDYIALWRKWKEFFDGDTIVYDYQLIWLLYHDPGFMYVSEIVYENMKNLEVVGINGMSSCQVQRLFFPTAFPMVVMAETLWNRNVDYNELKQKYFTEAFGNDGAELYGLLERAGQPEITKLEPSVDATAWQETVGKETIESIKKSKEAAEKIKILIEKNLKKSEHNSVVLQSWKYLSFYPTYAELYLDMLKASYGEGNVEKTRDCYAKLVDYVNKSESELHRVFDGFMFQQRLNYFFKSMKAPNFMTDLDEM